MLQVGAAGAVVSSVHSVPAPRPLGWSPPGRARGLWTLSLLICVGAGAAVWYSSGSAVLGARGTAGALRAWQTAPIGWAGRVAVAADLAAACGWLSMRHRRPGWVRAAAHAAAGVLVLTMALAVVVDLGRHHPVAGERQIADAFPLPWGPGQDTIVPADALGLPAPPKVDRVVPVRLGGARACAVLTAVTERWAAAAYVEPTSGSAPGAERLVCELAGTTPQGWSFVAAVETPASQPAGPSTVTVEVTPPLQ